MKFILKKGARDFKKEGIVSDYLPWILIAVAVLVILMIAIFVLKGRGFSLIEQLKSLIRG